MANKDNKHQLDRRIFILGSAAAGALAAQTQPAAPKPDGHRRSYDLNRKWLFGGKTRAGVSSPGFHDSDWRKITLPHTNVMLPWHSFAESAFQFVSAYRRHFLALPEWRGKRVFLDFGGAMTASTVTVNGHKFDEYKGGYTPFSFELTPHLKFDADNVIAVELDSTERADIPPFGLDIDYLTFGGIYRDVALRVVPKTFIDNVYAKVERPLSGDRAVLVRC
jgi:beta-galactosidase